MSTSTTIRRAATAAIASALGVTALAGPVAAETTVFKDKAGDLDHGADIRRVRVVNDEKVKVKVVHDDLVRDWESGSSIAVFLDTDRKRKGAEFVFLGGTFEGSDYALLPAKGWKRASDTQVPLNGGTYIMKLDYDKDTATIRFDREVLRNPRAVRVEVKTGGEFEDGTTGRDWLGEPRDFTRWVKRG